MNPDVSVVMSVFNGGSDLRASVGSILAQRGVDLEFVIVNDGSNDGSGEVLREFAARDSRVRLIDQTNRGLTESLIRGCHAARARFIARQDADNVAHPDRLRKQLDAASARPDVVLVSCGTRFIGPEDEFLYDSLTSPETATQDLLTLDVASLRGPSHHGATLFPVDAYRRVGGYRSKFRVAQDVDLWVRLAETGSHHAIPEVLQQARISLSGISSGTAKRQQLVGALILESARLRRSGMSDEAVLETASDVTARRMQSRRRCDADAAYFVGACLAVRHDPGARRYFAKAILNNPLHVRAWMRFLRTAVSA